MQNFNKSHWWLLTLAGVALLSTVQITTVQKTKSQTEELRNLLAATQSQSLQLMRVLGYGGLIHNFKNFVLRTDEQDYQSRTRSAATTALQLVTVLENNAAEVNINASLQSTREMIVSYQSRLKQIALLHSEGASALDIDKAVRFDDASAIQEVQTLVTNLSRAVDITVEQLDNRGKVLSTVTIIGTIFLSALTLALILNQRQRRSHLKVVEDMNNKLEKGNKELLRANTSLKQFASIVSHDLKTPLRQFSMFNDLIMEDYDDKECVQEHVNRMSNASKRMDNMIASLLKFTRAGFAEPTLNIINVLELCSDVINELKPTIDAASATVDMRMEGYVSADFELLTLVLHNLIANSLKYRKSDAAPHIQITTKQINDIMHFRISDNGIGIEPQYAERIFLPLRRLHSAESHFEGNGIGLSLVKSVIESHGGRVWLDKNYKDGARFEFTLTAAQAGQQAHTSL